MVNEPLVSIIIPTHNRKKMLVRLLKSILIGSYKNFEIIIIDDASEDNTYTAILSMFKKNKKIIIAKNKVNLLVSKTKNKGIKIARGDFLFFVDDDNVFSKNLIKLLVNAMIRNRDIGEIGPTMYYLSNKKKIIWTKTDRDMTTSRTYASNKIHGKIWVTDDIPNAYMVRREIIEKNKIRFDTKLVMHYEEADFAFKIRKSGFSIKVLGDAKIYHDVARAEDDNGGLSHGFLELKRIYYISRNRLIFHSNYSTKTQMLLILFFWNWLFAGYYFYQILFSKNKRIYFSDKINTVKTYLAGMIDGYSYALPKIITL